MSTRSVTEVVSKWDGDDGDYKTLAMVYRHHDGYLSGQGCWLFEFLNGLKVVNGLGGDMPARYANGPGRLASKLITALDEDGHSPDLKCGRGDYGQEYHYRVVVDYGLDGGTVWVVVFDGPMTFFGSGGDECSNQIFSGDVQAFGKFLKDQTD